MAEGTGTGVLTAGRVAGPVVAGTGRVARPARRRTPGYAGQDASGDNPRDGQATVPPTICRRRRRLPRRMISAAGRGQACSAP